MSQILDQILPIVLPDSWILNCKTLFHMVVVYSFSSHVIY